MNLLICLSSESAARDLESRLEGVDGIDAVEVSPTVDRARRTLREGGVEVFMVDAPLMDLALALRRAEALIGPPRHWLVLAEGSVAPSVLVRAAHFGFDGIIDPASRGNEIVKQLSDIRSERTSVQVHPSLVALDIIPGLFARTLSFRDALDGEIVDLLGLGLGDEDISTAVEIPVQAVRNRISRLIIDHGLSTRTQLAALHIRAEISHGSR